MTSRDLFLRVAKALVQNGARLSGCCAVSREGEVPLGDGSSGAMFELAPRLSPEHSLWADLAAWIQPSLRREWMTNADHMATPIVRKPVRIESRADEWVPELRSAKLPQLGRTVAERFQRLCREVAPSYATITIEQTLETPEELVEGPGSYAFRNFYVSDDLGPKALAKLAELVRGAYILPLEHGRYISTTSLLNPEGRTLARFDSETSAQVGRLIGRAFARHDH